MKHILLVDDDPTVRDSMSMLVEFLGYKCTTAVHGIEALTWLKHNRTDLVITDNKMPVLGGLQFLDTLQEISEGPSIPVILHSGSLNDSDKQRAMNAGAFAILDKPCQFQEIQRVIGEAVQQTTPDHYRVNGAFEKLDGIIDRIRLLGDTQNA